MHPIPRQTPNRQLIRAELAWDDTCTAAGIVVRANAPVLAMCRQLLAAGLEPDTALEVYRAGTLALKVRSIGEAAHLTVKTSGNGTPMFAVAREGAGASPVSQIEWEEV
jgi:hypothetical protein